MPDPDGRTTGRGYLRTALSVALFAAAMGYLEAAVVVYLRQLYYPQGFAFPLRLMERAVVLVELGREAATVAMLLALAVLAGRRWAERLAWFMTAFAIWDISYYVWLKVILDWPESWLTPDILFLIPLPWVGPVLSPVLVSLAMLVGAGLILHRLGRGGVFRPDFHEWLAVLAGAGLIFLSYVVDTRAGLPGAYHWEMLAGGLCAGLYGLLRCLWRSSDARA
ncbi:hypothetical protein LLH00_03855 [bacterium]|nr:hypothetical protein [bacterium]